MSNNMPKENIIKVHAFWDNEANVWVVDSDDVPGLVTEAETMEQLVQKLQVLIPELLEANGLLRENEHVEIPLQLLSERTELLKCGVG